jgi:hypothetical protein
MMALPACTTAPSSGGDPDGGSAPDTGIGSVDAAMLPDLGGPIDAGTDAGSDAFAAPDAGPIVDGGGSLTTCGGRSGGACSASEYCDYDGPPCGTTDGSGVCRARPERCAPATTMVCGCDGTTYASACSAASAGTDVSSNGPC